jgi:hypothetical protein
MKTIVFILLSVTSFSTSYAQNLFDASPDGIIWLCETSVTDFTIGNVKDFGLWRQENSLLSPSQHVSTWTFIDGELSIEYFGSDRAKNPVVECNYVYDEATKTLSIMHYSQRSQRWDYSVEIVNDGALVILTYK